MSHQDVQSYVHGEWIGSGAGAREISNAVTGEVFAVAGNADLGFADMVDYARARGGMALRAMTFHQRAKMLKALALHLNEHKQGLYDLSFATGGTQADHMVDIDGGIGTLFVYASKGIKELPDAHVLLDGDAEQFGKAGIFLGQHIYTPLQGVAVHINAFNFPVWGMLEKLAPSLLAGVPSVVKPATVSCYVTEACVRLMLDSGILPDGAVQLVTGGLGDTLEQLDCQDMVTFTGSADTAMTLRSLPNLIRNSVRFSAEQDSLNAAILGVDAGPETAEFELFIKEVCREMTVKAGQKCTAVRRILVPCALVDPVISALSARLSTTTVGDPKAEGVRMGALVSNAQKRDVLAKVGIIETEAHCVYGSQDFDPVGASHAGAFVSPMLFHCVDPDAATKVHETEAFGPVSTVIGYRDTAHAVALAQKGKGSLVASVFTRDADVACELVMGAAAYHGRLYINNRDSNAESTGHGTPMPHLVHGGPGRAGGGEELGGIRGVKHFMQRTAVQAGPAILAGLDRATQ